MYLRGGHPPPRGGRGLGWNVHVYVRGEEGEWTHAGSAAATVEAGAMQRPCGCSAMVMNHDGGAGCVGCACTTPEWRMFTDAPVQVCGVRENAAAHPSYRPSRHKPQRSCSEAINSTPPPVRMFAVVLGTGAETWNDERINRAGQNRSLDATRPRLCGIRLGN